MIHMRFSLDDVFLDIRPKPRRRISLEGFFALLVLIITVLIGVVFFNNIQLEDRPMIC